MKLMDRDRKLMRWINGHGFVTIKQAAHWMNVEYQTGHRRLKLLFDNGYLRRQTFEYLGSSCQWLTEKGRQAADDSLKPPRTINPVTLNHDRMLVDLAARLQEEQGGSFLPERRIRTEFQQIFPDKGWSRQDSHLPDGLLIRQGEKPTAIELELSVKESGRLKKIIRDYVINTELAAVWYYVNRADVARVLTRYIGRLPNFRIIMLEDDALGDLK